MTNPSARNTSDTQPGFTPGGKGQDAEVIEATADAEQLSLWKDSPGLWLLTLLGPPIAVALVVAVIGITRGADAVHGLLLTMTATFLFFGRFIILAGSDPSTAEYRQFFSSADLALFVFVIDSATAVLVAYHMNLLFRLPFLGKRLRILTEDGAQLVHSQRWMRRMTLTGVVLFVMLPLASTGSIGGALLGRLLGLSRFRTLLAVICGSALGCLVMLRGSDLINRYFDRNNPWVMGTGIGLIAALILLLNWRYQVISKSGINQRTPRKLTNADASLADERSNAE